MRNVRRNAGWLAALVALLVVAFASVPADAFAQAKGSKIKGKGDGQIRVNDADRGSGAVDLGVIDIDGRIYKPSVFYVLARGDIRYSGIEFRQNFLDRIVKGAQKRPF
ncbi:MAG: hypothetical protein ACOYOB_02580 [Myxococcota bacterium]|jgi:hypothetical protein